MIKKKLLVIDDSETNLMLLQSMFEDDNRIEVTLKNNGENIDDVCRKLQPDLILLDLMMPVINGFDVLEILQANQELKCIPVVIISALEGQEEIKKAIEMGATDYIVKPVDFEENGLLILKLLDLSPE